MTNGPTFDRDPGKRAMAVQLRALADAIQRTDSPRHMVAEAASSVAHNLQSLALSYVSAPIQKR
jgi:hypothetical protein